MINSIYSGIMIAVVVFAIFASLVLPALYFGSQLETRFWPVIEQLSITPMDYSKSEDYDPTLNYYSVTFNKIRPCDPESGSSAWYIVDSKGVQSRVYFKIIYSANAKDKQETSRPLGPNFLGIWAIGNKYSQLDSDKKAEFVSQKYIVYHSCHPFWRTQTTVDVIDTSK